MGPFAGPPAPLKTPQFAVAPLAGLLLAGCLSSGVSFNPPSFSPASREGSPSGAYGSAKLNHLRIGMSRQETLAIMGTPDSTSAQANAEYLVYDLDSDPTVVDRAYVVRLVAGRVESFGRFSELADLYDRPVAASGPGMPPPAGPGGVRESPGPAFAPAPSGDPARGGIDLAGQLRLLTALKDEGALTDAEFRQAKAKVLASL